MMNFAGLFGIPSQGGAAPDFMDRLNKPGAQVALRMLMASQGRPGEGRPGLGSVIGQSVLGYQQDSREQQMQKLQADMLKARMEDMQKPNAANQPSSVAEYEYAKQNGYKGTFEEWRKTAAATPSTPADIQVFEFWRKLPPDLQKQFTSLQRQPTLPSVIDYQGGKAWQDRVNQTITPVSTAQQEGVGQGVVAEGRAVGQARGEALGAQDKKGIQAGSTLATLDLAEPLIDAATGSLAGAGADKLAAVFGEAPKGAQAIAQLKVLQANLMTSMPRMEGPQSDKDVALYREAAGQIGDPTVPKAIKKAAVNTIRQINERYQKAAPGGAAPKVRKYNPATGMIE